MKTPEDVKKVISAQTEVLDAELQKVFHNVPDLPMYDHLAYFMGFKNEKLEPEITYGGKRFRSSLMLMLGEWYGQKEITLPFAVALELYHNFTLIHDDVIDRDTHRRGRPTVWKLFGHDHAINDGDAQLLIMSEMLAGASAGSVCGAKAQKFLLQQFRIVVEGQFLDFELTEKKIGDEGVTEDAYLDMIRRKTAELIVAAARGAGILAERPGAEQVALEEFGRSLGMAYQICDDTYSIWATAEQTGKRSYGDIKERKKTLPILFAHDKLEGSDSKNLEAVFSSDSELTDSDCEEVIDLLDKVETKAAMEKVIADHADKAKEAACSLSLSEDQQETLCVLVDSLLPKV